MTNQSACLFVPFFVKCVCTSRSCLIRTHSAAAETGKVSERNALQAIYRFVSHAMATEYEKDVFIGALNDLIGEFCADMPSGKESELRSLIYAASGLAKNKAAKTATERYISVEAWDLGTDEE